MFPSFLGVGGTADGCRGFTAALRGGDGCKNLGLIILEVLYNPSDSMEKDRSGRLSVLLEHDRMVEGAEQEEVRREKSCWAGEAGGMIADNPGLGGLGSRAVGFCGELGQSPKQPCLSLGWAQLWSGHRGEMWDPPNLSPGFSSLSKENPAGWFQESGQRKVGEPGAGL